MTRLLATLLALTLLAVACGDDTDTETGAEPVDDGAGDAAAPEPEESEPPAPDDESSGQPARIVSLSPSVTEILFAIGAGDAVVAADEYSDYPDTVPTTDLSGYTPNIEAIAAYEPDLVALFGDPGGITDGLGALDIETIDLPAPVTIDEVYAQIEQLGALTGHVGDAAELVLQMQTDIEAAVEAAPDAAGVTYFHELGAELYSSTSATFIGEVYGLFGMANVADEADPDGALGGYPQVSEEFLIDADPDLIFLADTVCCGQSAEAVAARPGWDGMSAVVDGNVIEIDDSVASRWGPRLVEFVEVISSAIAGAAVEA